MQVGISVAAYTPYVVSLTRGDPTSAVQLITANEGANSGINSIIKPHLGTFTNVMQSCWHSLSGNPNFDLMYLSATSQPYLQALSGIDPSPEASQLIAYTLIFDFKKPGPWDLVADWIDGSTGDGTLWISNNTFLETAIENAPVVLDERDQEIYYQYGNIEPGPSLMLPRGPYDWSIEFDVSRFAFDSSRMPLTTSRTGKTVTESVEVTAILSRKSSGWSGVHVQMLTTIGCWSSPGYPDSQI